MVVNISKQNWNWLSAGLGTILDDRMLRVVYRCSNHITNSPPMFYTNKSSIEVVEASLSSTTISGMASSKKLIHLSIHVRNKYCFFLLYFRYKKIIALVSILKPYQMKWFWAMWLNLETICETWKWWSECHHSKHWKLSSHCNTNSFCN